MTTNAALNRQASKRTTFAVASFTPPATCKCCGQLIPVTSELFLEERTHAALRNGQLALLTRQQFIILKFLAETTRPIAATAIVNKLYEDRADGGSESGKVIDVVISKLNKKLVLLGLKVSTTNRGPGALRYLEYVV